MSHSKPKALPTGRICPRCKKGQLLDRVGKFSRFIGCSKYPECSYHESKTKSPLEQQADELLKNAGRSDLILR